MKKITLILAMLLAFGLVAATAQDATVDGDATFTVGFDLNDSSFGFLSETSSSISLDLGSGTAATEEMDGWYGWIELADFEITVDSGAEETAFIDGASTVTGDVDGDGTDDDVITGDSVFTDIYVIAPDVTAKIVNGPFYIKIAGVDGYEAGKIDAVEGDEDDDFVVEDDEVGVHVATDLTDPAGSLTIGYGNDMFAVAVSLATENDYTLGNSPDNDSFLLGLDASVTAGPATIGANVAKAINVDADELGFGARVDLELGPAAIYAGFDGLSAAAFDWEAGGGVSVGIGDDITIAADAIYGDAVNMDAELSVDAAFGDLTAGLTAGLYDATATMEYTFIVALGYAIGDTASVSFEGGYELDEGVTTLIPLNVTVDLTVIPNTTLSFAYDTPDLPDDTGVVTAACTIEY